MSSDTDGGCAHALKIGSDGLGVVAYRSNNFPFLMVAHCSNVACSSSTTQMIDGGGDPGRGVSLAIGADGFPVISYIDVINPTSLLQLDHCTTLDCQTGTFRQLDHGSMSTGSQTAVAVDNVGRFVVAYTDSGGNLKVVGCQDDACSGWIVSPVASNVGNALGIAMDTNQRAVISYRDVPYGDLRVARCVDRACTSAAVGGVDAVGNVGEFSSVVYSSGVPLFSYYDLTNNDLKAAYCNVNGTFTVNSAADAVDSNLGDGVCADGTGHCTLRAALQEANGAPGPETIIVPAATYTLTIPGRLEDAAATGDLDILEDLTITGAAGVVVDGNGLDRVFDVQAGTVTMSDIIVQNGNDTDTSGSLDGGGGVRSLSALTMRRCSVIQNQSSSRSGGIEAGGTLTLLDSSVSNNSSGNNAGGVGGNATMTIVGSTVSGNSSVTGGGINSEGTVTLVNSTVSSNVASVVGGIRNANGNPSMAAVFLRNVTVTANTSSGSSGGGVSGGTFEAQNTIIAGNSGSGGPDCAATLSSQGHNLIQDTTGCTITGDTTGNLTGVASLDVLKDNGGPTYTHALLPTSPALNAGDPALPGSGGTACETTDQRGALRPTLAQGRCDIGAYEAPPPNTCGNGLVEATDEPPDCDTGSAVVTVDANGGSVTTPDHSVTLDVPAGALSATTTLSVSQNTTALGSGLGAVNITARPHNQTFQKPVTLTFKWTDQGIPGIVDGTNISELDLVLRRNGQRFSLDGFGVGPFRTEPLYTCADHLAGSSDCAAAVADCSDPPGTGHATVANCCDPIGNTWTFQTCSFSNDSAALAADPLVPGTGPVTTDCHAEWLPDNPKNTPFVDRTGFTNFTQTCIDGDECDKDGKADGVCTFDVLVAVNVPDPRLKTKTGGPACAPTKVKNWRIMSPKPDDRDSMKGAVAQSLRDTVKCLAAPDAVGCPQPLAATIDGDHQEIVRFDVPVTKLDHETKLVELQVPLSNPQARKDPQRCHSDPASCRSNTYRIRTQTVIVPAGKDEQTCGTSSKDTKCLKDNDKLTLVCKPPTRQPTPRH